MASIEFINKRIEGYKKAIEKYEKKLARIQKAKETNWEVNPYYYDEDDLKWTNRDLAEAQKKLAEWEAELAKANDKAASRNVPAITQFLDNWKQRMTDYYMRTFDAYPAAYRQYQEDLKPFEIGYIQERKMRRERPEEWKEFDRNRKAIKESFQLRFGCLAPYVERAYAPGTFKRDMWIFDNLKLEKDLTEEYNRKYDFIIERTTEIVKVITDASGLTVGDKGDLNGIIIGTNGTAKVQTIGAGGHNIQCFHFRTLIHRV